MATTGDFAVTAAYGLFAIICMQILVHACRSAPPTGCLSDKILKQFAAGNASNIHAELVYRHTQECAYCTARLEDFLEAYIVMSFQYPNDLETLSATILDSIPMDDCYSPTIPKRPIFDDSQVR